MYVSVYIYTTELKAIKYARIYIHTCDFTCVTSVSPMPLNVRKPYV